MASSPEYDKEPKAPDKSATTVSSEDSKLLHNSIHDQQSNSDPKSTHNTENAEAENNKEVEALDDKSLQALLEEAIAYKGPKDREGKSSLFKELLEEAEQDDQACEAAAARSLGGCRGCSLQDLVAALAAEPAAGPRRHNARRHAPAPSNVSTRATQGGSLPSGVDTSSLLSEEPARGAGYLATVRCVNPPPLAERRVSASDANAPHDLELLNRRSKPTYPMTYTARATLEIGSGSVGSGRAVTTTTASNQVRTPHHSLTRHPRPPPPHATPHQAKLMNGLRVRVPRDMRLGHGGGGEDGNPSHAQTPEGKECPRGPVVYAKQCQQKWDDAANASHVERTTRNSDVRWKPQYKNFESHLWKDNVNRWYEGLAAYTNPYNSLDQCLPSSQGLEESTLHVPVPHGLCTDYKDSTQVPTGILYFTECASSHINTINAEYPSALSSSTHMGISGEPMMLNLNLSNDRDTLSNKINAYAHSEVTNYFNVANNVASIKKTSALGKNLVTPNSVPVNPRNVRNMSIGRPAPTYDVIKRNRNNSAVKKYPCSKEIIQGSKEVQTKSDKVGLLSNVGVNINPTTKSKKTTRKAVPKPKNGSSNCEKVTSEKSTFVENYTEGINQKNDTSEKDIQLKDISMFATESKGKSETFLAYLADQEKLFQALENSIVDCSDIVETRDQKGFKEFMDIQGDPRTISDNKCFEMKEFTEMKSRFESIELLDVEMNVIKDYKGNRCDKDNENSIELLDVQNNSLDKHIEHQIELINVENMQTMKTDSTVVQDVEADELDIEQEKQMATTDIQTNPECYEDDQAAISGQCITNNKDCELSTDSNIVRAEKRLDELNGKQDVDDKLTKMGENKLSDERYVLAELPNNAYVFLTLPKRLLTLTNYDNKNMRVKELEANNNISPYIPGDNAVAKPAKNKKEKAVVPKNTDMRKEAFNKNALKVLLFEDQLRGDRMISIKSRLSPITDEVDSAIPFSCITTPEVVASCNTTSSASQSAVAVDAKPLQLGSTYRAVTSLTGAASPPPHPHPPHRAHATPHPQQPRSVIPSSFNGLPLSRPNYGSTATTAPDEYKKSLDENGNSVQGFSSPLAGSAQHKKPRRKKSSKNETVIDCRQIDGYQGDKDVNELLRFIESNAEGPRAPKLGRAKHRDDADDKAGKKRSTERRKDKDKVKRATSLEEVSRTKLEDLTAGPRRSDPHHPHHTPAGKPERRSWGDTREPDHDDPTTELTDFQTVTKKRKQRRRADEPAPRRPRAPSPPGPRHAPPSAPPSERSNDSNDDLDSAHSPPPAAPPAQPHASYAEIARTRHNIPDLIESCNFYLEGSGSGRRATDVPAPPPADADGYPALEARAPAPAAGRRARECKPPPPGARRDRKERGVGAEPLDSRAADCPAPDVVADRRPPVILLDAAARPGDMDGVTFGFDINEQLLSGPARRPRCDLLRDALEGGAGGAGAGGVAVRAGCAALRYVPPDPPADTHHLHQIIDYVGNAWEDVVRCGGGKVRYFSE